MGRIIRLSKTSEIPDGELRSFNVDGEKVLVANVRGKFYAVEDRCTHMGYPLYLGSLDGKVITCGFHYAKFDVTTGKVLSPPAHTSLKACKVTIKNSDILLELQGGRKAK